MAAVMGKLRHIILQQLTTTNPFLSEEHKSQAAEQLLIQELPSYITPQTHARLKQMTTTKLNLGLFPTLQTYLRDIQEIEALSSDYKPKIVLKPSKLEDGVLQTALSSNHNVNVNYLSSDQTRGRSPARKFHPKRSSGRSPIRDKSPRNNFRGRDRRNFRSGSASPSRRSNSSNYSSGQRFASSERRHNFKQRSDKNFRSRDQSSSSLPRQSESRSPSVPPRNRSSSFDSRASGRSQSRSRDNGRGGNRSFNRRSKSPGFNRSSSRDGYRASSQDSAKYKNNNSTKPVFCNKCASKNHFSKDCFRYPTGKVDKYCNFCLKHNRKLYHQEIFCRYKKGSNYRSPSNYASRSKNAHRS